MNSLQKQTKTEVGISDQDVIASYEKRLHSMTEALEVELLFKKLQFLGLHFDPFQSEIKSECIQILEQLKLTEHVKNPYLATNILLRLLDLTEEKLKSLKH
jgi:hypothetical protein